MKPMAPGLTDADKQAVAAYLTRRGAGRRPGCRAARRRPRGGTECRRSPSRRPDRDRPDVRRRNPPIKPSPADWTSIGVDASHDRFQRQPRPDRRRRAEAEGEVGLRHDRRRPCPTVVGDWLFVTNRSGKFYALDAKTGCVRWVVERLVVAHHADGRQVADLAQRLGDLRRRAQPHRPRLRRPDRQGALDAAPQLETHPVVGLTGTPVVAGDQLLVPITSGEEAAAMAKAYACCTFRGSLAALDLKTGKLLWKTPMITEPLKPIREKDGRRQMQGPAGAAIWSAPTVDAKRGLVYVATGDSYTDVDTKGADAIVAIELKTGKIRWRHQVTEKDNFVMGCGPTLAVGQLPDADGPGLRLRRLADPVRR